MEAIFGNSRLEEGLRLSIMTIFGNSWFEDGIGIEEIAW
jgi:hypothetical protein